MNYKNASTLKKCQAKFNYLNYAKRTQEVYLHYIDQFLNSVDKPFLHLNANDFQEYLNNYKFSSVSQQNQIINAIRFLFREVLGRTYDKVNFQRPRKEKHLPKIINRNVALKTINEIKNLKHKCIIALGFSVGLRVSEVINLKISDIDSSSMIIHIRQSKGNKDRIVPLTKKLLLMLRDYYKKYKPVEYIFNGQFAEKYSATSCNQIVKRYLGKQYHFHQLRHSCFTNLTDQGVDIRVIQKLAGHSSPNTTAIYTQVSSKTLSNLPLAL